MAAKRGGPDCPAELQPHPSFGGVRVKPAFANKFATSILVTALAMPMIAARQPQNSEEWTFHSLTPLGFTPLTLKPSNTGLTLMATAESPRFEGWHRVIRNNRRTLLDAAGAPVLTFPGSVDFRVTASERSDRVMPFDAPDPISATDANTWLTKLTFRLKIFHGLDATEVEPTALKNLGVPLDVPYDERIYLVSFDLRDVPVTDRLVLEVFAPDGERVGRFHLELL